MCMALSLSQCLVSIGLLCDIAGVFLLFRFGLPSRSPQVGHLLLETSKEEDAAIEAGRRRFERMARLALTLLVFGFGLQLVGALIR